MGYGLQRFCFQTECKQLSGSGSQKSAWFVLSPFELVYPVYGSSIRGDSSQTIDGVCWNHANFAIF